MSQLHASQFAFFHYEKHLIFKSLTGFDFCRCTTGLVKQQITKTVWKHSAEQEKIFYPIHVNWEQTFLINSIINGIPDYKIIQPFDYKVHVALCHLTGKVLKLPKFLDFFF